MYIKIKMSIYIYIYYILYIYIQRERERDIYKFDICIILSSAVIVNRLQPITRGWLFAYVKFKFKSLPFENNLNANKYMLGMVLFRL